MEKSKEIIQANTSCGREGGKKPGWVLGNWLGAWGLMLRWLHVPGLRSKGAAGEPREGCGVCWC